MPRLSRENKLRRLEEIAAEFDTSKDFDAVMAYYDVLEIRKHLIGKRVLEMGSSAGTVTKYLLSHSRQLDIVEATTIGIERTKRNMGGKVHLVNFHQSLWEEFEPNEEYTDIVFVRGLEHVEDPPWLLSRIREWLTTNGRIHIIVPNAYSLSRIVMYYNGEIQDIHELVERDFKVGHLRVYDKNMLEKDIVSANLGITYLNGFFVKAIRTSDFGKITMDPNHILVRQAYAMGLKYPAIGHQLYAMAERT